MTFLIEFENWMDVREIKALLALMQQYGLLELELDDRKKGKVRLVRGPTVRDGDAADRAQASNAVVSPGPATPRHVRAPARQGGSAEAPPLADNERLVTSPMVGTFYRASSPDASPFVDQGETVRKGQTLCIIEAMKMMNEIEAEVAGRIVKILCENAQPVEYGQPLMVVEIV
jgi:acetyl-CoA carboxylase biotin carboxyl carrier protein